MGDSGQEKLSFHTEEKRSETRNTLWQGEGCRRRTLSASVVDPIAVGRRLLTSKFQTGPTGKGFFSTPDLRIAQPWCSGDELTPGDC